MCKQNTTPLPLLVGTTVVKHTLYTAYIYNYTTYQSPGLLTLWFWRRIFYTFYGHGSNFYDMNYTTYFISIVSSNGYNRNCLGLFREIPWNQTTDVHRGSTFITLTLYNVTLTSQKPCKQNIKCDCSRKKPRKKHGYK